MIIQYDRIITCLWKVVCNKIILNTHLVKIITILKWIETMMLQAENSTQSDVVQRLGYLAFTQETRVRFPASEFFWSRDGSQQLSSTRIHFNLRISNGKLIVKCLVSLVVHFSFSLSSMRHLNRHLKSPLNVARNFCIFRISLSSLTIIMEHKLNLTHQKNSYSILSWRKKILLL